MQTVSLPSEVQELVQQHRQNGAVIGLVPTMGALHDGHVSLIEAARSQCDFVVATIFVNPTQFGPNEDFDRYPRTLDNDLARCQTAGADLVFTPDVEVMYPAGNQTTVQVTGLTQVFEGAHRPGHFDGVTTVVAKLFHIGEPDFAFFGQKDYQQQLVIRQMVQNLNWRLQIVTCPTIREPDGLAMSSRNRYLSAPERESALQISRSLRRVAESWKSGRLSATEIEAVLRQEMAETSGLELDYAAIVNADTLQPLKTRDAEEQGVESPVGVAKSNSTGVDSKLREPAVALVAAKVGKTRLIDNQILGFRS